ncbi:MAG: glycosyltransferase involved in cell wall biosynthesis [Halioglobus sp.]
MNVKSRCGSQPCWDVARIFSKILASINTTQDGCGVCVKCYRLKTRSEVMARVFIGIPTINRPGFVQHTVNSVLAQSYRDIEVIVSDNCSEPGVADSVKAFIAELDDPRIRFHQQSENGGEYGQGRYFLGQAEASEFFMILHDDDLLHKDYLERAITCLEQQPDCGVFVANANAIDENGQDIESEKQKFLRSLGRNDYSQGVISVRDTNLECGFSPISGTFFRTANVRASGFVDDRGFGNYPFETDVFLRLGDLGVQGWYQKEEMLSFRVHSGSMTSYMQFMDNEESLDAMARLLEDRQYDGYAERRRKMILSRLYRAKAMITVRQGQFDRCRTYIKKSFKYNARSPKLWLIAPFALIAPWFLRWVLPEIAIVRQAPKVQQKI